MLFSVEKREFHNLYTAIFKNEFHEGKINVPLFGQNDSFITKCHHLFTEGLKPA